MDSKKITYALSQSRGVITPHWYTNLDINWGMD